ncbi:MAG TPA: AMP-binding protein [Caldimonas sp.]
MDDRRALRDNLIQRVNVGDLLLRSAERFPNKEMVCDAERRWTYQQFDDWVNRIANGLYRLGLRPGESLALMSGNRAEFLATYFACARIGAVCVPINLLWRQAEIAYVLEHSAARVVVVEAALFSTVRDAVTNSEQLRAIVAMDGGQSTTGGALAWRVPSLDFDDLCRDEPSIQPQVVVEDRAPISYLYTSGTTSAPKGVVGSHLSIYLNSLGTALDTRMSSADRLSVVLPLFHTAQLNALCTPAIAVGASMVIQRAFDASELLGAIERERVSVLFALPMMIRDLVARQLAKRHDISSLRLAVYAMAPMPEAELRCAMDVLGCDFSLMFGQTEMSPVATFFRPEHQLTHPGAVGTPATNVQVGIMDATGGLLPAGVSGEIVYRSPQVMTGYLRNEAATDDAFREGWFHSGDAGHVDDDGLLWFEDRFKDVIKTGGENVSSIEIELAIRAAEPQVLETAAIGLPHERWGEAITAVVVAQPGASIDAARLLSAMRRTLSPYKCPKAVIQIAELPKTATGKVQKAKLRAAYASFYETLSMGPTSPKR